MDFTKYGTERVWVTPEIAEAWLQRNEHNRPIRARHVAEMAQDMRLGMWRLTHQGIAFDTQGNLIDGQHRLHAIVAAGVPVYLMVTTGMDRSAAGVIDTNVNRSPVDAMTLSGRATLLAGGGGVNTNAGMWRCMAGGMVTAAKVKMSHEELFRFADSHAAAGVFVLTEFGKHARVRKIHVAPVMAAFARAYYYYRGERSAMVRFIQMLCTGLGAHPGTPDENALKLRNYLMDDNKVRNSNYAGELYGKTAAAFIAFMQNRTVSRLYRPEREPFPLPTADVSADAGRLDRMALDFGRDGAGRSAAHPVA